jgi:hypothetical protein
MEEPASRRREDYGERAEGITEATDTKSFDKFKGELGRAPGTRFDCGLVIRNVPVPLVLHAGARGTDTIAVDSGYCIHIPLHKRHFLSYKQPSLFALLAEECYSRLGSRNAARVGR